MSVAINPSILSADFANLQHELERISTADAAHIDVMDNHFVPNLTWGPPVVKRLREVSPVPFDVHLMIDDPDRWAPQYADVGSESVTFHAEAATAPIKLARTLRESGAKAGLALRPATAVEPYLDLLTEIDMLLIMTVEPGFGGQKFLDVTLPKIRRAASALEGSGIPVRLQVDGGITEETIVRAAEAGADCFVAGSSVYGAEDPQTAIAALRSLGERARKKRRSHPHTGINLSDECRCS